VTPTDPTDAPTTRRAAAPRGHLPALLGTQVLSTVGSSTSAFALSLWIYAQSGSATLLGMMFLASTLPAILLGPHAGALVDRLPRRLMMLVADTVAAAATLGAVVLVSTGTLEAWHVIVVGAVQSLGAAFQEPAYGALVAGAARDDRLDRINGVVQLGPAIGLVAGPALAGLLLTVGGLPLVLGLDLVTFVVAVVTLAVVRLPESVTTTSSVAGAPRPPRPRVVEGWRILVRERGLLHISLTATAVNLLFGFVNVLLVPLLLGIGDEASAGLAMAATGAGMLVGSLAISAVGGGRRPGAAIGWGIASVGLGVMVAGARPSIPLVAVGSFLLAIPIPMVGALSRTLTQRAIPAAALGRVLGLRRTLASAALPLAHVAAGPLHDRLFAPAMTSGGALAPTLGRLLGTGPGRGAAAIFVLAGVGVVVLGARLARDRWVADLDRRVATPGGAADPSPAAAVAGAGSLASADAPAR
jgi:MFS transporter, DHA3 family, macrolide efflux protein